MQVGYVKIAIVMCCLYENHIVYYTVKLLFEDSPRPPAGQLTVKVKVGFFYSATYSGNALPRPAALYNLGSGS